MRRSGLLLHPTSLPGGPIGSLGSPTRAFIDFLVEAGQTVWQMLPIGPTGLGFSPYMATSAAAIGPMLVSRGWLVDHGLLEADAMRELDLPGCADLATAEHLRSSIFAAAFEAFDPDDDDYRAFCADTSGWLDDFSDFTVLFRAHHGRPWTQWSRGLRDREPAAMEAFRASRERAILRIRFEQWVLDRQWRAVRAHANERGIELIGDVPIFVSHDSADVWAHRELFDLDSVGRPTAVAGVPPDYFSETGQRWGNPLYRWDRMADAGYAWWIDRFRRTFDQFDAVRVDHFRGFEAYWRVPADEDTAINGTWQPGPGRALFDAVREALGDRPIIAEDLGSITPEVEALRDGLGLPGMKVIQFGFSGDPTNPHALDNHVEHAVVYTGTHDNDTATGWYADLDPHTQHLVRVALGCDGSDIAWELIDAAWRSPAELAITPVQDLLSLGSEARMNTPGTSVGNWRWRLEPGSLTPEIAGRLRELTETRGRVPAR